MCPVVHLDCADSHSGRCFLDLSSIVEPAYGGGRVAIHSAVEGDRDWRGHLLVG